MQVNDHQLQGSQIPKLATNLRRASVRLDAPPPLRHAHEELTQEGQATMNDGFELRMTGNRGEGVFSTRSFQLGETVLVGRIDRELDHNHPHASQIGEGRFVLHGGLIPKVNHSCESNCGIRPNASGAHDLVARKIITLGEEITFDYAMRNYSVEYFPDHCRCGSCQCREHITGWKDLPAQRKVDYHGFVAPYLISIDKKAAPGVALVK